MNESINLHFISRDEVEKLFLVQDLEIHAATWMCQGRNFAK